MYRWVAGWLQVEIDCVRESLAAVVVVGGIMI